jgi:acyl carrier protein
MDKKEVLFKKEVTEDDIKNIIKEQLSVSEIKDSDRLIDDLFADSLDVVEILMNLGHLRY